MHAPEPASKARQPARGEDQDADDRGAIEEAGVDVYGAEADLEMMPSAPSPQALLKI